MKQNLRNAILMLVGVLMAGPLLAQPGPGRGPRMTEDDVKARVEMLADTLKMSDKQEKQILESELKFFQTMQKERENFDPETGDRDAMRAKMRTLREERDAQYKAVLSEEQYTLYQKIQEERRAEMQRRRSGQGQGPQEDPGRGRGRGGGR